MEYTGVHLPSLPPQILPSLALEQWFYYNRVPSVQPKKWRVGMDFPQMILPFRLNSDLFKAVSISQLSVSM